MAFIRRKRIGRGEYLYLVEGVWKNGQASQRVIRYLGPAEDPDVQKQAERLRAIYARQRPHKYRRPAAQS